MSLGTTYKFRCCYSNPTDQFQIVRVVNRPYFFFERTIAPRGSICFEADSRDTLEVHTSVIVGAILSDRIPCDRLQEIPSEARQF